MSTRKRLSTLFLTFLTAGTALAGPYEVYFSPNGGFAPMNQERNLQLANGKEVTATIGDSLYKMIDEAEEFGQIKICLYAMGDMNAVDRLVAAARDRRIKVKLILDGCADWTQDIRRGIYSKIIAAREECKAKGLSFDFQLAETKKKHMIHRHRTRRLDDGKYIYGTNHEKFGVFYRKGEHVPFDSFCGSANASYASSGVFAENRCYFFDRPGIARQFQEEFARLWNEWADCVDGDCESEMYVEADPIPGEVKVIFNSEPVDEDSYYRIDEELDRTIQKVRWREGSLDLAMFSITHRGLCEQVINQAIQKPESKFRILLDQSMMMSTDTHIGVMGPWFEEQVEKHGLKNLEVRYKWRSTAYGYDEDEKRIQLVHWRSLLLHHKLLIVNGSILECGSYNWSSSAEMRNLENLMVFNRSYRHQGEVIDRFQAEYNTIWDALKPEGEVAAPIRGVPQTVSGPYGRKLATRIIELLNDEKYLALVKTLYGAGPSDDPFKTAEKIGKESGQTGEELNSRLADLVQATLLCKLDRDGKTGYTLAD